MKDLTIGPPAKNILEFSFPLIIGNLFQQLYNIVDSVIVGKFIGKEALAAVGSSYTVMVFLTSILIGLCMGSSISFSQLFGAKKNEDLKISISMSFYFISFISLAIMLFTLLFLDRLLQFINIPLEILLQTKSYIKIILYGIPFVFLYNWCSSLLRALGDSKTSLYFLILSALTNVILDYVFVVNFSLGIEGAALATIVSQFISALLCFLFCKIKLSHYLSSILHLNFNKAIFITTASYSLLTSLQQSIMNFGILLIQGLVNSFGVIPMAAFAAAAKIDSFAYMPVQDFGNAFSTYIAQNTGAGKTDRIKQGFRQSLLFVTCFCIFISLIVLLFSSQLMLIFIKPEELDIIKIGKNYLFIVSAFYCLIGYLFLFYGFYRGIGKIKMSVVLTIVSLGTRVLLAHFLAPFPSIGLNGIWWAIPAGWLLADIIGFIYYKKYTTQKIA